MKDKRKCITPYCRNLKAPQRNYCYKCTKRKFREKNPMRNSYNNLKQNAKRRGKEFDLTFEEFKAFCIKHDYISKRGRGASGYTIDRDKNWLGYTANNIRARTNSDNVKKYYRVDIHFEGGEHFTSSITSAPDTDNSDAPF